MDHTRLFWIIGKYWENAVVFWENKVVFCANKRYLGKIWWYFVQIQRYFGGNSVVFWANTVVILANKKIYLNFLLNLDFFLQIKVTVPNV